MIINNSKKALAAKIRNSGFVWPDSGKWAIQDKDGEVFVCSGTSVPVRRMGEVNWEFGEPYRSVGILSLGSNWFQCILSRDEYFHLYPAPDADGWIEWRGGERPVGEYDKVTIRLASGYESSVPVIASLYDDGGNWRKGIIAYRLHKPEHTEQEYRDGIKPIDPAKQELTIEQLATDYRAKLAIAQKAQEEADSHRCGAEAALENLVAAGNALGLVLSVAEQVPELIIAIQAGDEVECVKSNVNPSKYRGMVGTVLEVDGSSTPYLVDFGGDAKIWCHEVKFIRRP